MRERGRVSDISSSSKMWKLLFLAVSLCMKCNLTEEALRHKFFAEFDRVILYLYHHDHFGQICTTTSMCGRHDGID